MNFQEAKNKEKYLPRWIQILLGVALGPITILCLIVSVLVIIPPNKEASASIITIGLTMSIVSIWAFIKCIKMIFGKKVGTELLSPATIRIVSILFLLMPIGGIFAGDFKEKPIIAWGKTISFIYMFLGLQNFAKYRELKEKSSKNLGSED